MAADHSVQTHPLPFALDDDQLGWLSHIREHGFAIASPGTENYEALFNLVDRDLLSEKHCPEAMGVHQFELTDAGLSMLGHGYE